MATTATDFEKIKEMQQIGWETGDYPRIGNTLQIMAEQLVEAADVRAGAHVIDVACGQGNAALAAARRFADATGVDYAANLLAQGRARAEAEHLPVRFVEGDAERLPYPDGHADLALSTVGVMFAPNHRRAADELVRVTRSGGTIALASWTPTGMIGAMFKVVGRYAPPPPGVSPPVLWGTPEHLTELFGTRVDWSSLARREYIFRYHSPEHFAAWFLEFYGPITKAAATLSETDRRRFADELAEVARSHDRAGDGTLAASAEYLEAVGTRH